VKRKITWLSILVACCVSSVFAQKGIVEFTANGTFKVPSGVTKLRVDVYGGGGGGGGTPTASESGGGGGGGAYTGGVLTVSHGESLTIVVGAAGTGGAEGNPAASGTAGGDTQILSGSTVVFAANGGQGGQGGSSSGAGSGGAGGAAGTYGSINHAGANADGGVGAVGYIPIGYTRCKPVSCVEFGAGGEGGVSGAGANGTAGYVLISW